MPNFAKRSIDDGATPKTPDANIKGFLNDIPAISHSKLTFTGLIYNFRLMNVNGLKKKNLMLFFH